MRECRKAKIGAMALEAERRIAFIDTHDLHLTPADPKAPPLPSTGSSPRGARTPGPGALFPPARAPSCRQHDSNSGWLNQPQLLGLLSPTFPRTRTTRNANTHSRESHSAPSASSPPPPLF